MNYKYFIEKDGKYVDLKTLPLEEQAEIRKRLSEIMAATIAKNTARQKGKEISNTMREMYVMQNHLQADRFSERDIEQRGQGNPLG